MGDGIMSKKKLRKGTRVNIFGDRDKHGGYIHGGYKQGPGGLNQILIPTSDKRRRYPAVTKPRKYRKK